MEGRRPLIRSTALFFTTLFAIACSGSESPDVSLPPEPPVEQLVVSITPKQDSLLLGTSRALVAAVTTTSGAPRNTPVTWASLAPDIVSVANGTMTAFAPGQALIVASAGTSADTATIRVTQPVYELRLTPDAVATTLGDTLVFEAHITGPGGASTRVNNVTWSLSDSTAAELVGAGTVNTLSAGELEVYATVGGTTAMAAVSVSRARVASLAFVPNNLTLTVGEESSLRLVARDSRGRVIQGVVPTFTTSRPSVATVDGEGTVTAVATGGAIVTGSADGKSTTATVNVNAAAAASVRLTLPNDSLGTGRTMRATATPLDASGNPITGRPIAWQSSNPSVATISSTGVITSLVPGQATISVICDGHVASQRIFSVVPVPASLQVVPTSASIALGASAALSAEVRDQFGVPLTGLTTSWSSTAAAIASVSNTGVVTGLAIGSASVRATHGTLSATVPITVPGVPVATVTLTPATSSMVQGGTVFLIAVARDAAGNVLSNRPIAWTSSAPTVATVAAGQVSGVGVGTSTITATVEGKSAQSSVTVTPPAPLGPSLIVVTLNSSTLAIAQTTNAQAVAYDQNGAPLAATFTYASGNTQVATVSGDGRVRAIAPGTTTVTASAAGVIGMTSVTVQPSAALPVDTVVLSLGSSTLVVGDTTYLTVETRDSTGAVVTGRTISFTTSNTSVVRVSPAGMVLARGPGIASLTATSEGKSATVSLSVSDVPPPTTAPVSTVTVSLGSSALTAGQGTQASATLRDSTGAVLSGRTIAWSSSNPSVATVSQSGYVTAIGAGAATISAQSEGKNGGAGLSVQASTRTVATVSVAVSPGNITVGSSAQATAVARDSSGAAISGLSVTWAVSPSGSVASISGGSSSAASVTGIGIGTATISATISGVTGTASLAVAAAPPSTIQLPALPTLLNFSYPTVTGKTWSVRAGDNLQTVLNQAQRGDEIVIQAGATFTGNFTLPVKSGTAANGWILIRSDQSSLLPPEGTRVTAAHASRMPKLVTNSNVAALATLPGTSGWWISGIEFSATPTVTALIGRLVALGASGASQNTLAEVPNDLVLDRVYVHPQPNQNVQRCVEMNSGRTQISDSYLVECHAKGFDSQAIVSWNGPGPFKIVNNTLQGAGENVMFGGADPSIPGLIPSDAEIRRNYFYTPASWKNVWTKKNLFETKNAQRLLLEGNVFEGSWADGQVGYAFVLKVANQSGGCGWCTTNDITIRHNIVRNVGAGFAISGKEGGNTNPVGALLNKLLIENNIVENVNTGAYLGDARLVSVNNNPADITIRNNTLTAPGSLAQYVYLGTNPAATNFAFQGNVASYGSYGLFASGGTSGETVNVPRFQGAVLFEQSVIIGSQRSGYPSATFVSSLAAAQATGRGANAAAVASATQGVVIP